MANRQELIRRYSAVRNQTTRSSPLPPTDNQDQEETKSLCSTQLVSSRPNSPAALNRVARAFGTWAFDVEQQEALSFNIPSPDGNEGLASTFVIPSPTVARNPAAARNRGELLLGRRHLMPKSRTLLPLDGPTSAMRQASPVPGSLTIKIIGHECVSGS